MCGIFAVFGYDPEVHNRETLLNCSKKLRHRGPDWNGIYISEESNVCVCHERLSIVGVNKGAQPIFENSDDKKYVLSVNGEIYNYKGIKDIILQDRYDFTTDSDCEVILHLYRELGVNFINMLDGVFSFALYDSEKNNFLVARDPIGVNPLYYAEENKSVCVASELKAIREWSETAEIKIFPPGHYMTKNLEIVRYYNPKWMSIPDIPKYNLEVSDDEMCKRIRKTLTKSVEKRLMTDVPFGVLLSGGLDSSLTSSIASKLVKEGKNKNWGQQLHSFSIGLEGAPDLKFGKMVAEHLGTIHHEFHFTVEEGIDAIRDVIYHLETYDVTTIRASTPMFLLSRKIKAMGIKMVLSGEGADEVYGGYLYFHNAPTDEKFHEECCKRVKNLHNFDCLRANKSTMAWGLEVRVPFLDKEFLNISMPIRPNQKLRNIEKYILRKAFDPSMTDGYEYLPKEVLWRQKEQFSDGVGYNWIDSLIENCGERVSNEALVEAGSRFEYNTPTTKEGYYFREIFEECFPNCERVSEYWIPNTEWEGVKADPSGRAQGVHLEHDKNM